jgi:O-antigen ligase
MRQSSYFKLFSLKNFNLKSFFTAQTKTSNSFVSTTSQKFSLGATVIISLLIFLSIIPLAAQDAWNEAVIVAVIFVLSGVNIWLNNFEIENRQLITPIFILAGYSFLQGFATVIFPVYSVVFPISFNPAASVWSGFKILAFAFFLNLLLQISQRSVKFLTWSLIITGNFFAVFGIARYLLQPNFSGVFERLISPQLTDGVGFGTYFNQNHFAYLMLLVFGLNISLFWYGKMSKSIRFLLLPASLITWTALVLTGSRGGIIGSFAEITVLIFLPVILSVKEKHTRRKKAPQSNLILFARQSAIFVVIFGLLIAGIFLVGQDRVVERFEDIPRQIGGITNAATFRRTDVWLAALAIIKDFPVFGIGFGGFQIAVSQYIEISGQIVPKQAHNDYLELAASGGIIAVGLAIWFLRNFFALVKKRFAEPSDSFSAVVRAGAICGLAGAALHNFFDFGLQITANLLFFAALLCLAVHKPQNPNESAADFLAQKSNALFNFPFSILCLILACSAVYFGFARYRFEQAKINLNIEFVENKLFKIPFDADYYETRAKVYEHFGNFEFAASEAKKAIEFRPKDYNLRLILGQIEQLQNNNAEAENAFRQAIELAPNYGKPYFYFGNFLVKTNRKDAGFAEFRNTLRRNPAYFDEIVAIVWSEKTGNADEAIKVLQPLDVAEKEKLSAFLFEKGAFATLSQMVCREDDLAEPSREGIVRQLLEKRQYYFADRIYKRNCDTSGEVKSEIEDGGFDNRNLKKGTGFGWRVQSTSSNTIVSFDEGIAEKGQSLKFNFNGQDSSYELLSQTIIVEKKRKYQLKFSYKTGDIITGGIPVLQVLLKHPEVENTENIVGETKLPPKEKNWTQSSIEFETDNRTEAVEIRLTRKSCAESLCPIFGNLWLDDFSLQKKN